MAADTPSFRPESLLEHEAFLRALAQGLLPDSVSADDVLQEAYLALLTHPPGSETSLRAWLARVVTNRAHNLRREEERRARREREVARSEVDLQDDVRERLAIERRVLEAVTALREPYRSTIWLRWHEGLPPRAIATKLGLSIDTVNSRLQRGLAELRTGLDREFGDRRSWCLALLPWIARPAGTSTLALGSALILVGWLLAGSALVWGVIQFSQSSTTELVATSPPRSQIAEDAILSLSSNAARESPSSANTQPTPMPRLERGLVLDLHTEEPVPALTVARDHARSSTSVDGRFELEATDNQGAPSLFDASDPLALSWRAERGALLVDIGPTWQLEFDGLLPCSPEELQAELAVSGATAMLRTSVRPAPEPWVRFRALPELSLLGSAERSSYVLRVFTRDGLWSAESRVHARRGIQLAPVHLKFEPRVVAPTKTAVASPTFPLVAKLSSRSGHHRPIGRARAVDVEDRAQGFESDGDDSLVHFAALPAGEYIITPPLGDGYCWLPGSACVRVPGGERPEFICCDDVRARSVRVEARAARTGAPLPRVQFALLVDRKGEGKPAALAYQGSPQLTQVDFGQVGCTALPDGMDCFWLVEADGFISARGLRNDLSLQHGEIVCSVRLEPSWKTHLAVLGEQDGQLVPLAGARLVTSRGKLLAESLADGEIELELAYDPGQLRLELAGWSLKSWEGWWRGKPRGLFDPHHVVFERVR